LFFSRESAIVKLENLKLADLFSLRSSKLLLSFCHKKAFPFWGRLVFYVWHTQTLSTFPGGDVFLSALCMYSCHFHCGAKVNSPVDFTKIELAIVCNLYFVPRKS